MRLVCFTAKSEHIAEQPEHYVHRVVEHIAQSRESVGEFKIPIRGLLQRSRKRIVIDFFGVQEGSGLHFGDAKILTGLAQRLAEADGVAAVGELDGSYMRGLVECPNAGEYRVVAVIDGEHGVHVTGAGEVARIVGDNEALEAPFRAEQVVQQCGACAAPYGAEPVKSGHDAAAFCLLYGYL